jgi:hypothetical protein
MDERESSSSPHFDNKKIDFGIDEFYSTRED